MDRRKVSIDDLYKIVLVGDARVSPDGSKVAYVQKRIDREKDDYETNIWLWEGGESRRYTAGDKDSSPRWSPDGSMLAFLSKREGKTSLFLLHTSGGEAEPVPNEDELQITDFVWSPDSTRIVMVVGLKTDEHGVEQRPSDADRDGPEDGKKEKKKAPTKVIERVGFKADGVGFIHDRRRHLQVLNVKSRDVTRLTDGDYNENTPAWSPDGRHIAFSSNRNPRWDVEMGSQIWQISADGGEPKKITSDPGMWMSPTYSPSGKEIALIGAPMPEGGVVTGFAKLWKVDRKGTRMTNLLQDVDIDVGNSVINDSKIEVGERLTWDKNGIWFLTTEAGSSNICRWQDGLHRETEGNHEIRDFSVQNGTLAYTCADGAHPGDIFLRRKGGETQQLTFSNKDYLESVQLSSLEPLSFKGSEGEEVAGWVMRPVFSNAEAHPLIVYVHGGPQSAYGHSFFHEMQVLAAEGFGVLLINPHGSASHGEAFESSIHGDWGNRDFKDVMAATDLVASMDWVDDHRLAIAGGSYGGYMGSWAIGHTDRFAAAVVERSLTNMLSFAGTTDIPNWWQYAWRTTIDQDPMKLWNMSPIAYLKDMATPTLVIHSENDHRCPIEQGEQLFVGLRRRSVPTRFLRFPEESHGLSRGGKPSRREERLNEILGWFRRYV